VDKLNWHTIDFFQKIKLPEMDSIVFVNVVEIVKRNKSKECD
jgi:hypothetical protein